MPVRLPTPRAPPAFQLSDQPGLPPLLPLLLTTLQAFAADLEKLFTSLRDIDTELLVQAGSGGVSASVAADDAAINRFLLDLVRWVLLLLCG